MSGTPQATPSGFAPDLLCLDDVQPRAVKWLWEPFIPTGMLTMLSDDPGAGKSFIALSLAAELSRGRLRDSRIVEPASTLYLSVENPIAESLRPRFDALGGDARKLYILRGKTLEINGESESHSVSLADIVILDAAIAHTRARLIVVDPVQSYLGATVDLHRSNETRPVMDGLSKLAEAHGCAILLLRHLSKQSGGKAIHRGLGSIDLTAAVRSELLAGSLPNDEQERALIHLKSNVGRIGHTLGYAIDGEGRFAWTGESSLTAADLLAVPAGPGGSKLAEACEWLKSILGDGPKEQQAVEQQAEQEGISHASLRRAKKALKVHSSRHGFQGAWMWQLPDGKSKDANDAHTKNLSTIGDLSTFEDAQKIKDAQDKSFISQRCSKYLCEHLGEHLCADDIFCGDAWEPAGLVDTSFCFERNAPERGVN